MSIKNVGWTKCQSCGEMHHEDETINMLATRIKGLKQHLAETQKEYDAAFVEYGRAKRKEIRGTKLLCKMTDDEKIDYLSDLKDINEFMTVYSVWNKELEDDAILEPTILRLDGWGRVMTKEVEPMTWFELWRVVDNMVRESDDHHHIFLEGLSKSVGGITTIYMGS